MQAYLNSTELPNFNITQWSKLSSDDQNKVLQRPEPVPVLERDAIVSGIFADIKKGGDQELIALTKKYDGVTLDCLKVSKAEIKQSYEQVSKTTIDSIKQAMEQVKQFHSLGTPKDYELETLPGVRCFKVFRPIPKVGLYVPGGTAPLPSSLWMQAVPAALAGCDLKIVCTPPGKNGKVDPHLLVTADLCGIQDIFKLGGAQAIAAMALGTQSIPQVDKIFGPGNAWVTAAKMQVNQSQSGVICDLPAGPSEVLVIADKEADPEFVAWDLLSQAEHGFDSQIILITDHEKLLTDVHKVIRRIGPKTKRAEVLANSLKYFRSILVTDLDQAIEISNTYAPEHLILNIQEARRRMQQVRNAGSVFLGRWTPESVGDYASGTNHVLPTSGFARSCGGLGVESFMKPISFQELDRSGISKLGPIVEELANVEGLEAHKNAVSIRLAKRMDP
ncbi:MAG: histidinol dehydrogenase [Oligoflexales bacterium]|nr:histidinol dehydrogenase [Oligoflexales bacterium]